ncbi:sulfate transporter permease CysT [Ameyamaea chiangmaiensis NBRC 103196]|nr:sulfate ABC transporter permease subunit CysT [Ameyamaea chiangmaiensis]MBS4074874.1 sulfate ABC transporter permease subunit CysT [Ameyamaea chiangmaiensis]GBQ63066.1 sulfate transporter permease CysT [Ameyamaea chiangmaiensis NBRC 103196]
MKRLLPHRVTARRRDPLPGLGTGLGVTIAWLGLLVVLPLAALIVRPWQGGAAPVLHALHDARMLAALRVSVSSAAFAALLDLVPGLVLAWALVRGRLPGRRVIDALVDLPFALPTAVTGITMATLYGPRGWLGAPLAALGLPVAFTPVGIVVALTFVGLPFVVRAIEPVLRDLPPEIEEAAETLGARPGQILRRVVLPPLLPALVTGFGLAFARGIGEYGSVIFIAGNQPFRSEIAPLLIVIRLQEFDYAGASAIGFVLLVTSILALLGIAWVRRRLSHGIATETVA